MSSLTLESELRAEEPGSGTSVHPHTITSEHTLMESCFVIMINDSMLDIVDRAGKMGQQKISWN